MPLEDKRRFIRTATSRITLEDLCAGWLRLSIEWSPLLDANMIIDEVYIWTQGGKRWTDEEKQLIREQYSSAERDWLLERIPERSWESIITMAGTLGVSRPRSPNVSKIRVVPSLLLSVSDWQLMQQYELPVEDILTKRATWREFIVTPVSANSDERLEPAASHLWGVGIGSGLASA
jgi:hypothetical protein